MWIRFSGAVTFTDLELRTFVNPSANELGGGVLLSVWLGVVVDVGVIESIANGRVYPYPTSRSLFNGKVESKSFPGLFSSTTR